MKTYKRPMFRRGGNVGIMSGMQDTRTNFQDGTTEQMIKDRAKLYRQYAGDPIANLLIQGGLGLVSGEGAGKGTLGAVATAFRKPTEQALAQEQQIGLKAVGDVLSEKTAKELTLLKAAAGGDKIALQKLVNYAISMGEFPDTPEGRRQAFKKYSVSAGDVTRLSKKQQELNAAKKYENDYGGPDSLSLGKFEVEYFDVVPKGKRNIFKSAKKGMPQNPKPGNFYFDLSTETTYYYDGKFNPVTPQQAAEILKKQP